MTALPSDPQSADDSRHVAGAEHWPIVLTFEDKLQLFWRRQRGLIIAFCLAVLCAIIGVGVWEGLQKKKEREIQSAYAAASTPEALKTFADAHPGHSLAGIAYLRLADDLFAAGKAAEALPNYEKAVVEFKTGPFAARAKLGVAVSKVIGGKIGEGSVELKQLAEDVLQFKGVRTEAAYHLASLAAEAGNAADVLTYSELLMKIDPAGSWTQRAFALRSTLPSSNQTTAEPAGDAAPAPAIQFTPAAK